MSQNIGNKFDKISSATNEFIIYILFQETYNSRMVLRKYSAMNSFFVWLFMLHYPIFIILVLEVLIFAILFLHYFYKNILPSLINRLTNFDVIIRKKMIHAEYTTIPRLKNIFSTRFFVSFGEKCYRFYVVMIYCCNDRLPYLHHLLIKDNIFILSSSCKSCDQCYSNVLSNFYRPF